MRIPSRGARFLTILLAGLPAALAAQAGSLPGATAGKPAHPPSVAEKHMQYHEAGFAAAKTQIRSADGRAVIPFTLVNNHVVIPATIQGVNLRLVLDTGMPMDGVMLYRTDKVTPLKLEYAKGVKARIGGAGAEGGHLEADMAENVAIDIGDLGITAARAIVAAPIPGLASYHDGIIGATLFKNFVVSIDYDARRITLHEPASWSPPEKAASVPLTLEHDVPYADVTVVGAGGKRMPATVVVDLGASHPISLNLGAIEGLAAPDGAIRAIIGRGVSGRVEGRVGRIAGLEIGGLLLKDVVATFPDPSSQRPGGMHDRGGNLGDGVLQRFNVAFDYARKRMLLAPNESFAKAFEWDMSGLWIQPDAQGALRVEFVTEKSPARAAGIAPGDILARVDGKLIAPGDLAALRERLRTASQVLELTMLRDGKPIAVTLKTTRMI